MVPSHFNPLLLDYLLLTAGWHPSCSHTNLYTRYTKMYTVKYGGEMQMGDGSGGNLHFRTEP